MFPSSLAVPISVLCGLVLLGTLSFYIARAQKIKPLKVVGEYSVIALVVIIITHYLGDRIRSIFS